jgi:hypothetical protein
MMLSVSPVVQRVTEIQVADPSLMALASSLAKASVSAAVSGSSVRESLLRAQAISYFLRYIAFILVLCVFLICKAFRRASTCT